MSQKDHQITIYSDYVCPFCYLGRRSFEEYQETRERELELKWHPFDLRSRKRGPNGEIDPSIDDGKDEAYFEHVKQNVARLREAYDANEMLNLDELPEDIDSLNAQIASFYVEAEQPDQWLPFDEAILEALWVEGRDIGDIDVLTELAENVGLDSKEIRNAIADDDLRYRLREKFTEAQQHGVTGVPTFVYDRYAVRGAAPPEQLGRLVEGT